MIDDQHSLADSRKRGSQIDRGRGLPDAAFLVRYRYDSWVLHEHDVDRLMRLQPPIVSTPNEIAHLENDAGRVDQAFVFYQIIVPGVSAFSDFVPIFPAFMEESTCAASEPRFGES